MGFEFGSDTAVCHRCGKKFSTRRGYFFVSHANLYRDVGYLPYCKDCVQAMFEDFYSQCNDIRGAMRCLCRKLDLYWNNGVYHGAIDARANSRTIVSRYMGRISNSPQYDGKSYEDTLAEEGTMWDFSGNTSIPSADQLNIDAYIKSVGVEKIQSEAEAIQQEREEAKEQIEQEVDPKVIKFWGPGFDAEMYNQLEERRKYWMSRLPNGGKDIDVGTEAIIRQICPLELDINRDRLAGKSVDKSVNTLNSLLGSANLKPVQRANDMDASLNNTPFGVWTWKLEHERPVRDVDPDFADADGIAKYISTWFYGHAAKSLGVKNMHSKLYDQAMEKYTVQKPEYEGDDDDLLFDVLGDDDDGGDD